MLSVRRRGGKEGFEMGSLKIKAFPGGALPNLIKNRRLWKTQSFEYQ